MKQTMKFAAVVAIALSTVLVGCKKDDVDAPVVTLVGNASENLVLNASYTDAGATAKDERDGDLTSSIVSDAATAVKKDLAGTYTVTYTSTDAAGNAGTATRTVAVKNDADKYTGNYSVAGTDGSGPYSYSTGFAASSIKNNKVTVAKFGGFTDAIVYFDITGTTVTVPSQTVECGVAPNRASRTFVSTAGSIASDGKITITYNTTTNGSTGASTEVFTKQ
jgi:hypothetical protein